MSLGDLYDAGARAGTAGTMTKTQPISDALGHKSVLDKQRAAIDKLRAQNEALKHDLLLENKFSVRPGDPYAQALINQLQDEGDNLARKVGAMATLNTKTQCSWVARNAAQTGTQETLDVLMDVRSQPLWQFCNHSTHE
jgi:hypothetical protein